MSTAFTLKVLKASTRSGGVGHRFLWVVSILCLLWVVVLVAVLAALLPLEDSQFDVYEEARCSTVVVETAQAFTKCERDRQVCVFNAFTMDVEPTGGAGGGGSVRARFIPTRCTDNAAASPTEELLLQECYKGAQTVGATYTCYTYPNDPTKIAFLHKKGSDPKDEGVGSTPYLTIAIVVPGILLVPLAVVIGAFCFIIHDGNVVCKECGELGHEAFRCSAGKEEQ